MDIMYIAHRYHRTPAVKLSKKGQREMTVAYLNGSLKKTHPKLNRLVTDMLGQKKEDRYRYWERKRLTGRDLNRVFEL